MGKVIGILLIVISIWLGLQYWTAEPASPDPERAATSRVKQVGERVSSALEQGAAREEKLLPE